MSQTQSPKNSLTEQLKALEQLQEIDLKIDRIRKDQAAIPASLKAIDDSLGKSQAALKARQAAVTEIQKTQRQTQAALDMNRDRLTRSNSRLEAVQNTHEFQAASKEQEQLRKMIASLEEQSKKSGGELEKATQDVASAEAEVAKLQGERDEQAGKLSGQSTELQSQIAALTQERVAFTSQVEPRTLALYDRVRPQRGGLGIVPAVGGRCKGCNMMVPPQQFNEIQKGSALHSCPSCHRILYVKSESPASAANT